MDSFIPSPAVLRRLDRRIAACEAVIDRTQRILDRPFEAVGSYVTGSSHRPRSLDRQLDAENNWRSQAYQQNTRARSELALLQTRRELYVRSEVNQIRRARGLAEPLGSLLSSAGGLGAEPPDSCVHAKNQNLEVKPCPNQLCAFQSHRAII